MVVDYQLVVAGQPPLVFGRVQVRVTTPVDAFVMVNVLFVFDVAVGTYSVADWPDGVIVSPTPRQAKPRCRG